MDKVDPLNRRINQFYEFKTNIYHFTLNAKLSSAGPGGWSIPLIGSCSMNRGASITPICGFTGGSVRPILGYLMPINGSILDIESCSTIRGGLHHAPLGSAMPASSATPTTLQSKKCMNKLF